ncbi:MAG TPA: cupin domain-containing protein [Vicinamibacterales bacterium]
MTWHVTGSESGGQLTMVETVVRAGGEPPLHVHAREDEAFYVIEGQVLFQRGLERITAGPGQAVLLPRGIPHGFAVRSTTARMLLVFTPAGLEEAFRSVSVPAETHDLPPLASGPPDPAALTASEHAFGDRGVTFVGPPLPVLLANE